MPKRAARDLSPADSDGYNSGEDKSERPIGRGQAKLHPQPLLPSPVCPPPSDSREILFERTHSHLMGNAPLVYCTVNPFEVLFLFGINVFWFHVFRNVLKSNHSLQNTL